MEASFLTILNMSITASWIALVVMVIRLFMRRAPRNLFVVLWAIVGIRLVFPDALESSISLLPSGQSIPPHILTLEEPAIHSGILPLDSAVNAFLSHTAALGRIDPESSLRTLLLTAAVIWIIGAAFMLVYAVISYFRVRARIRETSRIDYNTWISDWISTPFILGILRPRVYLPSFLEEPDKEYVVAHEESHIERHDHLWKPLGFVLLAVHWFNPVIWVAYALFCRDIERACDEKVLHDMGVECKKPYSKALINCSVPRRTITVCPLAFGEIGVKERVKAVLKYKEPAFWIVAAAVVIGVAVAVCFLTNPETGYRISLLQIDGDTAKIEASALNSEKLSDPKATNEAIHRIDSTGELKAYFVLYGREDVLEDDDIGKKFDEDFFEEKTLFLVQFQAESTKDRHVIRSVYCKDDHFGALIERIVEGSWTSEKPSWIAFIAAPRDAVSDCTEFDAAWDLADLLGGIYIDGNQEKE